jgi:hypothetical protein
MARTTGNRGIERDPIANTSYVDGITDFDHRAGCFMTHHDGWDAAPAGAIVAVHVAAADSAGGHAHEHVAWAYGRSLHRDELKFAIVGEE